MSFILNNSSDTLASLQGISNINRFFLKHCLLQTCLPAVISLALIITRFMATQLTITAFGATSSTIRRAASILSTSGALIAFYIFTALGLRKRTGCTSFDSLLVLF